MENAKLGHHVEFHGFKEATHLNGTRGTLLKLLKDPQRWVVRCHSDKQQKVCVKLGNMKRVPHDTSIQDGSILYNTLLTVNDIMTYTPAEIFKAPDHANAWAVGLDKKDHYEWFCNCYKMRCDDDYVWGGCYLHGPNDPMATPTRLAHDFLVFCLLAKKTNAIPVGWDWPRFLEFAPNYISFPMSKSHAKQRWGSENYFNAGNGGRSLRFTGTQIYGSPVDRPGMSEMHQQVDQDAKSSKKKPMQEEVGGVAAWHALEHVLEQHPRFFGYHGL